MKICAVMQPHYLPWAGYFNLIFQAQQFVFLDDVQYEKQSWQNRNRILLDGEPHWLTVPAQRRNLADRICDVKIDETSGWRTKHIKAIEHAYSKKPYKADLAPVLDAIEKSGRESLSALCTETIRLFAEKLDLNTPFSFSNQLEVTGQRSERLVRFCERLGCDTYLSTEGAREYLETDGVFKVAPVTLKYRNYKPGLYPQGQGPGFVPSLSIVDVVANLGWAGAATYIRSGSL